jgi:hypothetical protein
MTTDPYVPLVVNTSWFFPHSQFVYIETRRTTQCMQSGVNAIKRTGDYLVPYMAPYLMNYYLRKYLIKGELRCSGRVSSSYATSGTRRAFRKIK